jgi:hypothetical protein
MNIEKLRNILESIQRFTNKVAYRAFPVGEAPQLPFICYQETGTDNFYADGVVLKYSSIVDIELYSKNRDTVSERLIEEKLEENGIAWTKDIEYLDDEKCYEVIYTVEV